MVGVKGKPQARDAGDTQHANGAPHDDGHQGAGFVQQKTPWQGGYASVDPLRTRKVSDITFWVDENWVCLLFRVPLFG